MTNRRKRAAQAVTEAEEATEAAFMDMGAAELAWMMAKIEHRYDEQEDCKRDLRRTRNAFRKHLKEYHVAAKEAERINAELDRKRDRQRERERIRSDLMHDLKPEDLTMYHAGRFQRWGHGDDVEAQQ
jgi:hypothetical protein